VTEKGAAALLNRAATKRGMLVARFLALPCDVLAVELAYQRAADDERDREIARMEAMLGSQDKMGIARILNTLLRIFREV
jgi:hypothetical protein